MVFWLAHLEKYIYFSDQVVGFPARNRTAHTDEKNVVKAAIAGDTNTKRVVRTYVSSVLERGMAMSQKTLMNPDFKAKEQTVQGGSHGTGQTLEIIITGLLTLQELMVKAKHILI
jgi:hypothetical protein